MIHFYSAQVLAQCAMNLREEVLSLTTVYEYLVFPRRSDILFKLCSRRWRLFVLLWKQLADRNVFTIFQYSIIQVFHLSPSQQVTLTESSDRPYRKNTVVIGYSLPVRISTAPFISQFIHSSVQTMIQPNINPTKIHP